MNFSAFIYGIILDLHVQLPFSMIFFLCNSFPGRFFLVNLYLRTTFPTVGIFVYLSVNLSCLSFMKKYIVSIVGIRIVRNFAIESYRKTILQTNKCFSNKMHQIIYNTTQCQCLHIKLNLL